MTGNSCGRASRLRTKSSSFTSAGVAVRRIMPTLRREVEALKVNGVLSNQKKKKKK